MSRQHWAMISTGVGLICGLPSTARAQQISAEEATGLRDEIRILKDRLAELEKRLDAKAATAAVPPQAAPAAPAQLATSAPKPAAPATSIDWKGSPQFASDDRLFKVKGRIQADFNYVSRPDGLDDRGLGFSSEFRRIRLGGEGKLGSGFGYKLEAELSDNAVDLVDTFVTYEKGSWLVTLGNHNQFQSLDELIGDTTGSVMERAAFTDAFNFERRLGLSVQHRAGDMLMQAGVFTDDINALSNNSDGPAGGDENNSFSVDGRFVYAPKVDDTQLHFGMSGHLRTLNRLEDAGVRYRQRPYLHSSNTRILATPQLDVDRELNYGVELAGVRGPWHIAAEGHWLTTMRPGLSNPTFFGTYAEVGYYLTEGDSRAYRNGIFATANPKRPINKGGIGAVQVNLRYDYLDLNDDLITGGKQNAYLAALIWTPINYLRFNVNYGYIEYDGAAILAGIRDDYSVHTLGTRMELDF